MDVKKILSQMTLEEKAAMCQGADSWHIPGVPRLGVKGYMITDGPNGLRKVDETVKNACVNDSLPAVCFPTSAGMACSFDRELMEFVGGCIGDACQANDVHVLLGPGVNIKRSPLCGRNFEYFSEDPYLAGEMGAAHIRGVQSRGVGASLKHFAANNQETRRLSVDARIGERALREIYLAAFERAAKGGKPWTVMCAYNKLNGVYGSENAWLMTDVLRGEWGFDGMVMTDWGACRDHVEGVAAGVELEMPRVGDHEDQYLAEAVRTGRLPMAVLDRAAERVLTLLDRIEQGLGKGQEYDAGQQHHMARKAAREAMVLLKNEDDILPIRGNKKVAFIGEMARTPRYQGGGSSHINATEVLCALDAVRAVCPVKFAAGYAADGISEDAALRAEAVELAKASDMAVLFLGVPECLETEGFDRPSMELPATQVRLLEEVASVQPNTVVVLHSGSPVVMPWLGNAKALLAAYLSGQAGGGAVVDLLFGAVSPCGKLAETYPLRVEDTPSYLTYAGCTDRADYAEGIYVGYRYYDKRKMDVLFPFGFGLSYTNFVYDKLRLSSETMEGDSLTATVEVTNTGKMMGKEIVQLYIRPDHAGMDRPVRELRGFEKVTLMPGETATVTFQLDRRAFAYWDEDNHTWQVEGGRYVVEAAASSRDIRQSAVVTVVAPARHVQVTEDTILDDVLAIPGGREVLEKALGLKLELRPILEDMASASTHYSPIHGLYSAKGERLERGQIAALVQELNALQQ